MYQVFVYSINAQPVALGNPCGGCAAPLRHRPDQDRRRNGSETMLSTPETRTLR